MNQITKPRVIPWNPPPPRPQTDFPIVTNQGINYQLVPLQLFEQLKAQNDSLVWLSVGLGAMAIAAGLALVINFFKPLPPPITADGSIATLSNDWLMDGLLAILLYPNPLFWV